jgi:hypothetical protein
MDLVVTETRGDVSGPIHNKPNSSYDAIGKTSKHGE